LFSFSAEFKKFSRIYRHVNFPSQRVTVRPESLQSFKYLLEIALSVSIDLHHVDSQSGNLSQLHSLQRSRGPPLSEDPRDPFLKTHPLLLSRGHHRKGSIGVDDDPISSTRGHSWKPVLLIVRLIAAEIHSRLQLSTGTMGLEGPIRLSSTQMYVVDIVCFSSCQLSILSQEHHRGHRRVITFRPRKIETNSLPLPMVSWVMPVTFTQFQDNPLRLTRVLRGGLPPKVKGTEAPEFLALVLSNWLSVNHTDPQPMPLRQVWALKLLIIAPTLMSPCLDLTKVLAD
jgi:hypothetical protein